MCSSFYYYKQCCWEYLWTFFFSVGIFPWGLFSKLTLPDYQIKGWECFLFPVIITRVFSRKNVIPWKYPQQYVHVLVPRQVCVSVILPFSWAGCLMRHPWGLMETFQGPGKSLGLPRSYPVGLLPEMSTLVPAEQVGGECCRGAR